MGTTSDKLTYLEDTKELIRKGINSIGGDLITSDTFRSYADVLETIWEKYPKVTGSGTTITLSNTQVGKMKVDLKGNTIQDGEPTPDAPVEIQVVTGDNSIKVEGKNLFNLKDTYYKRLDTGSVTINDNDIKVENVHTAAHQFIWWNIPIIVGDEITISYNSLTESTTNNNNGVFYTFNDEPYTSFVSFENFSKVNKTNKYSTTTATKKYLVIGLRNVPSCTNTLNKLQIEKGNTPTTYEPYQSQTYPINLGSMELCKIGDYQDYLYKENGIWYKYGAIGKVILKGSGNTGLWGNGGSFENFWEYQRSGLIDGNGTMADVKTNYFNQTDNSRVVILGNGGLYLRFPKASGIDISNATLMNNWLSTHNTIVYYVLATPTITEITDTTLIEQLDNLEKAYSYDTQTNISQTNDDLPFVIKMSAIRDLSGIFELISQSEEI